MYDNSPKLQAQSHTGELRLSVKDAAGGRGRVQPSFSLNASLGVDCGGARGARSALINFTGLLSGTAVDSPRAGSLRLRAEF